MDPTLIAEINKEAIYVLIMTSGPILLISLTIGLIVSLFQALTQIQETTLTFVPKLIVIYLSLMLLGPYITSKLTVFTDHMVQHIIQTH